MKIFFHSSPKKSRFLFHEFWKKLQQEQQQQNNKTNKINTSFAFDGLQNLHELANLFWNFFTLSIFRLSIKTAHASTQKF